MNSEKFILFIVNPKAGKGAPQNLERLITDNASKFQTPVEIVYTAYANHAFEIAQTIPKDKYKTIVSVGGDGTMNEILKALITNPIPLAIVPTGSGNGLARFLNIPLQINHAVALAFTGKQKAIDALKINDTYSFNVSGIGFDALVAHRFHHLANRGLWGYVKTVLKNIISYKPIHLKIHYRNNEQEFNMQESTFILSVANSNQFGNDVVIAPKARINDGKMNLILIKPIAWYLLPFYAIQLFLKKIDTQNRVIAIETKQCTIYSESVQWHIDGEAVILHSPVHIKVLPLAVRIILSE